MSNVVVVIGAGLIGQAIARRIASGRHVLLADVRLENAQAAARVLGDAGFATSTATVDVSSADSVAALVDAAASLGEITHVIQAAGVSASQASIEAILRVDLYGTALVLKEFGSVIARDGAGVVISSQSGHRLPALTAAEDRLLATTPVDELLGLPCCSWTGSATACTPTRCPSAPTPCECRPRRCAWGERGARVNAISPGIVITPLANDELNGPNGAGYRKMIELMPAGRAGTPDEIGTVGELLLTERGAFITGSDILIDGGGTAAHFYGALAGLAPTPKAAPQGSS